MPEKYIRILFNSLYDVYYCNGLTRIISAGDCDVVTSEVHLLTRKYNNTTLSI